MSLLDKEEYINHNLKMMINFEDEVKWLKHYASFHEILLVGDGDFSFSLCLAKAFGSASKIVATSLDAYDVVISKYKNAKLNLQMLEMLGATVLHGVDATKLMIPTDFKMKKFDRIIFNFPHAGFHGKEKHLPVIKKHRKLVHGFFRNASRVLSDYGEVHVNHKTTPPFCYWNLEELALKNSLLLIDCIDFKIADYPGYNNKRGDGSRCDQPFPLGKASTYKFTFSTTIKRGAETYLPTSIPVHTRISNDCYRTFDWYLDHAATTFEMTDYDVARYAREGLRRGRETFMAEHPGRPLSDYIILLEELHHLSVLRSIWLRHCYDNLIKTGAEK